MKLEERTYVSAMIDPVLPRITSADIDVCLHEADSTYNTPNNNHKKSTTTLKCTESMTSYSASRTDKCPDKTDSSSPGSLSSGSSPDNSSDTSIKRTVFTRKQLTALETRFIQQSFLSKEERKELADELKLSERQVMIWFQNRRGRLKRRGAADSAYNPEKLHELHHRRPYPFLYGALSQSSQNPSLQRQMRSVYPEGLGGALANALDPNPSSHHTGYTDGNYYNTQHAPPNVNLFADNSLYQKQGYHQSFHQQYYGHFQQQTYNNLSYSPWNPYSPSNLSYGYSQRKMKSQPQQNKQSYSCDSLANITLPLTPDISESNPFASSACRISPNYGYSLDTSNPCGQLQMTNPQHCENLGEYSPQNPSHLNASHSSHNSEINLPSSPFESLIPALSTDDIKNRSEDQTDKLYTLSPTYYGYHGIKHTAVTHHSSQCNYNNAEEIRTESTL